MIVVFTSSAFTTWVSDHIETSTDSNFNPYLTFLFFALYVSVSSMLSPLHLFDSLIC